MVLGFLHLLLGLVLLSQHLDVLLELLQLSVPLRQTPPQGLCLHLGVLQPAPQVGRLALAVPQHLQALLLVSCCQKLSTGSFLQLGRLQGFVEDPDQLLRDITIIIIIIMFWVLCKKKNLSLIC